MNGFYWFLLLLAASSLIACLEVVAPHWRGLGRWLQGKNIRSRHRQSAIPGFFTNRRPPRCPHCEGVGRVQHVMHCVCGMGSHAFSARGPCPLCGGLGIVPSRIARDYDAARWTEGLFRWRVHAERN